MRDLQLVVEVRVHFTCYPVISGRSLARRLSSVTHTVDILFEHDRSSGVQGYHGDIRKRRRYPVDKYHVPELAGGTAAQLPAIH